MRTDCAEADSEPHLLRLLVLLAQVRPTGLVRQLLESLSRLADSGVVEATVICIAREGADTRSLEFELDRRGLAHEIIWERGPFDLAPLRVIRSRLTHLCPDALQSHGYKPTAYALRLRRAAGVPWVAFYHGRTTTDWKVRLYHLFDRWAMGRADAIVTVAEGVEAHFRPVDRSRLRVVPNGVVALEPPVSDAETVREIFGLEGPGPVVGFVGRLSDEKGPDLFLEAFALLAQVHPGIRGLVAGDGPMRTDLEKRARLLGIDQAIRFTGQIARVSEMYRAMDVLVISSRSEVFPNVLLEAVDAGLPVAATQVGGVPGVAVDLDTIVLASELSPASIAAAVTAALGIGRTQREAARKRMHEVYSQKRRAEALSAIYLGLSRVAE